MHSLSRLIPILVTATLPMILASQSPAKTTALDFPLGVAISPTGTTVYISERRGHRVRQLDLVSGVVTTIAGTGVRGFSGDGGPAADAMLGCPDALDIDSNGTLYIADRCNERIRRIDGQTGVITTVAGTGERGPTQDGPALSTALTGPFYLRVEDDSTILFTDTDANLVRQLDLTTGRITTLAGSGASGFGGDGGMAHDATLSRPHVVFRSQNGDLLIGDSGNERIRIVEAGTDIIRTIAGNGEQAPAVDGAELLATPFFFFGEILEEPDGNLLLSEWVTGRILRIDRQRGQVVVLAGTEDETAPMEDGHPLLATRFGSVADIALDAAGRLIIVAADAGLVRRLDLTNGTVETLIGVPSKE